MNSMYVAKTIEYITLFLLVVGGLVWGVIGLFKFNVVEWLASKSFAGLAPIVYILVGLSAIIHVFSRDYYLPFLGDAVFPCGALVDKAPDGADTTVSIHVAPNVNVVYWAAEPNTTVVANPSQAYNKWANNGVTTSDANGTAVLKFRKPTAYKVHKLGNNTLKPHVHYRVCKVNGMLGRVETVYM